ncbi:F-box protein CPR1-like [Senna tora]|uniref:F-box protein CPR1-like n=2 Tax=Senna tora TaxID=362788 RepID=A0A834XGH2_9FABA|nr:F-box protein CPR1-like [Senna tora]
MNAGVGSRPSHTWRSLLAGRELLAKGLQKYVGDGKSTLIWKEPWIPGLDANEPLLPKKNAPIVTWVYELMNNGGRSWNEQKLEDVFDMEICPMKEVWNQINIMPDLFCSVPDGFWKSIWNLPLLSRYKLFMWRACVGIIPCVGALRQRVPWNQFGKRHGTTLLLECTTIHYSNGYRWSGCVGLKEQRCHLVIALYLIWERRNLKKFQSEVVSLNNLWPRVEKCWDELQLARQLDTNMLEVPPNLQWEKPRQPFIKLNVDTAVKSNGEGALGGVLRDCDGCVIGDFTGSTPALSDVALLEAMAVEKGMYVAKEVGVKHIIVESDSRIVVNMLNSNCDHASLLCAVCRNIIDLSLSFNEVCFKWIPRSCNNAADCMSSSKSLISGYDLDFVNSQRDLIENSISVLLGFGIDPNTADYKVVQFEISSREKKNLTFEMIQMAPVMGHCETKVAVSGEQLACVATLATHCRFELWVMKEYGVESSWTMKFNFEPSLEFGSYLEFWGDEEILMEEKGGFMVYNLRNQLARRDLFEFRRVAKLFRTYLNGIYHWIIDDVDKFIVCFDFGSEAFDMIQMAPVMGHCETKVTVIGEQLACVTTLATHCRFELWVMEEYGVESSWTMKFNFESSPEFGSYLGFWGDEEILMEEKGGLMLYNLQKQLARKD